MAKNPDERLTWLLKLSRDMLSTRDLDHLLTLVTDAFIEASDAERGVLFLKDRETGELERRAARSIEDSGVELESQILAIPQHVFRERTPVVVVDRDDDSGLSVRRTMDELKLDRMVCAPLATESDVFGVIYADAKASSSRVSTAGARQTIEILADHAAVAIENAQLFERATNDPLTGLPNNSYFALELGKSLNGASSEKPLGVLLVDIDAFKRVNTAAGAEAGDRALLDLARTIKDVAKTDGLVARYGSDKFAVLLPPEPEKIELRLRDVAERIRAAIATKAFHDVQMSCCIGGSPYPRVGVNSGAELMVLADNALSRARTRGRSEIEIA